MSKQNSQFYHHSEAWDDEEDYEDDQYYEEDPDYDANETAKKFEKDRIEKERKKFMQQMQAKKQSELKRSTFS